MHGNSNIRNTHFLWFLRHYYVVWHLWALRNGYQYSSDSYTTTNASSRPNCKHFVFYSLPVIVVELFQNNRNLHTEIKSRQQVTNTLQPSLQTIYLLTPMSAFRICHRTSYGFTRDGDHRFKLSSEIEKCKVCDAVRRQLDTDQRRTSRTHCGHICIHPCVWTQINE